MMKAALWEWLTPSLLATIGITSTEQGSRGLISRFEADPGVVQEAHLLLVGLASIPALLRAPEGFVRSLTRVPWWITAILAAVRVQANVWIGHSVSASVGSCTCLYMRLKINIVHMCWRC